MTAPPQDIATTYVLRLGRHRARAAQLSRSERRVSRLRLACVLGALATFWIGYDTGLVAPLSALLFVPAFAALVVVHDRLIHRHRRSERAAAFYERALARLEDRWIGTGTAGDEYHDPAHPFSGDLDLFGRGSLFELLCLARTRAGEDTLAGWLTSPAPAAVAVARQQAVAELRDRVDLREDLAVIGEDVRSALEPAALLQWAASPVVCDARWARIAAPLVVAATAAGAVSWAVDHTGALPFLGALAVQIVLAVSLRSRVQLVLREVQRPTRDLGVLVEILARLECEPVSAPRLCELKRSLEVGDLPPSQQIARLRRIVDLLDTRKNELFAPIAALLLWGTQCALAVESWRRRSAAAVPAWLAAVGEIETLVSLAGFAAENPRHPFPEFTPESPHFSALGLSHPLLPRATRVANDVQLGADPRVLLVSGSNMSGKSTLLRSVGVNAVLAQAGAPVCATRLTLSPLAIGASLRIIDSLQSGTSHFYAELKRLRQIVDITAGPVPLLFLLDEILHGTNSHDRRIGAEAVVRELVRRGAIGLVTTHDLALAAIATDPELRARNVHFEDHIDNGEMRFDYRMRPGVVQKSNALDLMRAVGLTV